MKFNRIINESAPTDFADLFMLTQKINDRTGSDWQVTGEEGVKHGDACPECGMPVTNRRPFGPGAPVFLGCNNHHAFLLPDRKSELETSEVGEPDFGEHTCDNPPVSLADSHRIKLGRRAGCEACEAMEDYVLDAGFEAANLGYLPPTAPSITDDDEDDDDSLDKKERFMQYMRDRDPRHYHRRGKFGTGSPEAIQSHDQLWVAYLKNLRDEGVKQDPRTGKMMRIREKDTCQFGHTCGFYPNGRPAANYPLPDPMATLKTGKGRFNNWFEYNLKSDGPPGPLRQWPVSGLSGFSPKPDYEQFVTAKYTCRACLVRELGRRGATTVLGEDPGEVRTCSNKVSSQGGQLKPYCSEHLEESPYVRDLMSRFPGGLRDMAHGDTVSGGSYQHRLLPPYPPSTNRGKAGEVSPENAAFFKLQGESLEPGDHVMVLRGPGFKKLQAKGPGRVQEVDSDMFDNGPGFRVAWEDGYESWFSSDQVDMVPPDLEWE